MNFPTFRPKPERPRRAGQSITDNGGEADARHTHEDVLETPTTDNGTSLSASLSRQLSHKQRERHETRTGEHPYAIEDAGVHPTSTRLSRSHSHSRSALAPPRREALDPVMRSLSACAAIQGPAKQEGRKRSSRREGVGDRGAGLTALLGLGPDDFLQSSFSEVPLDWSIKTRCRFTSPYPFGWCKAASAEDQGRGLTAFLERRPLRTQRPSCASASSTPAPSSASPVSPAVSSPASALPRTAPIPSLSQAQKQTEWARDFHQATLYWVHPANMFAAHHPIMRAVLDASVKNAGDLTEHDSLMTSFMHRRWIQWESSFRSLYYRLRVGECAWFYYRTAINVILFLGKRGTDRSDQHMAIISKSTSHLRMMLKAREVRFRMPLRGSETREVEEDGEQDESLAILRELEHRRPGSTRLPKPTSTRRADDSTLSSILVVEGRQGVHALYDVLLNFNKRAEDVPVLLSEAAFVGASLQQLEVTRNSTTMSARGGAVRYALDVAGPVLPFSLAKMCHIFSQSQKGEFQVRSWASDTSSNVNALATYPQLRDLTSVPTKAFGSKPEVAAALQSHVFSQALKMAPSAKRIRCDKGVFHVSLGHG